MVGISPHHLPPVGHRSRDEPVGPLGPELLAEQPAEGQAQRPGPRHSVPGEVPTHLGQVVPHRLDAPRVKRCRASNGVDTGAE